MTFILKDPAPDVSTTMINPITPPERMPSANAAAQNVEIHTLFTANASWLRTVLEMSNNKTLACTVENFRWSGFGRTGADKLPVLLA